MSERKFEAVYYERCYECGTAPHGTVELVEIFTADHSVPVKIAAELNAREAKLSELESAKEAAEQSEQAMAAKLQSLLDGGHGETCGCSHDRPGDVCMHHSPMLAQLTARVAELEGERDQLRAAVEVVIAEERYRLAVFRPGMYQELSLQHKAELISTWSQFGFVEVRDWDSGSHWWVVNFCMTAIGVEPSSETRICKTCYREWKNHIDSCPVCHSRIANCIAGMRDATAALTPKPGEGK